MPIHQSTVIHRIVRQIDGKIGNEHVMIEDLKGIGIVLGGWTLADSIRDEADLEALKAQLLAVESEMVKSNRAALWLVPRIATKTQ